MIYMQGDVTIVVLETKNIQELLKGRPAKTPDKKVLIAWTPDMPWLSAELQKLADSPGGLDGAKVGALIDEARTRPENPTK